VPSADIGIEGVSMFYKTTVADINGAKYILHNDGKVFGLKTGAEIKQRLNPDGYLTFTAGSKQNRTCIRTHRAVASAFIPNPNNLPEVDHLDNNRANPVDINLEWCTHQENIRRSYARGCQAGRAVGIKNPKVRLSESDVIEIRRLYDNNIMTQMQIAKQYNIGWSTVHNVVFRFTWKHI
jgi:hypothetical protein